MLRKAEAYAAAEAAMRSKHANRALRRAPLRDSVLQSVSSSQVAPSSVRPPDTPGVHPAVAGGRGIPLPLSIPVGSPAVGLPLGPCAMLLAPCARNVRYAPCTAAEVARGWAPPGQGFADLTGLLAVTVGQGVVGEQPKGLGVVEEEEGPLHALLVHESKAGVRHFRALRDGGDAV